MCLDLILNINNGQPDSLQTEAHYKFFTYLLTLPFPSYQIFYRNK